MEPPTCPESISEPPRIHIWQSHVGLLKLAISRRYYKIFFPNYFRKSRPPIGPLEFRPRAKSYFRWSSTYQLFQKKFGLETFFFLIFRFQDINKFPTSGNNQKPLFHFKPSGSHFTETLFQTSTPCRVHPGSLYPGISDLCTAPAEEFSKPVQPQPQRAQG